jgi:hypothetical protein
LKAKRKTLSETVQKVLDRLAQIKQTNTANDVNIKQLQTQVDSINEEIQKLYNEKKALEKEWNDKHYKYDQQQKLLDYINNAQKKINDLKKKIEKDKKRQEKYAKKQGANQEEQTENAEEDENAEEEVKFGYEIATTEWLISYFKGNEKGEKKDNKQTVEVRNEDNKLVPIVRNDNALEMGLTGVAKNDKKKGKGPKVSKREQKVESTNILSLDLNVINKIKDVKLTAPVFKTDVPAFVAKLENIRNVYISGVDHTVTVQAVPQPKVEVKHEEPKVHAKHEEPKVAEVKHEIKHEEPKVTEVKHEVKHEVPKVAEVKHEVKLEEPKVAEVKHEEPVHAEHGEDHEEVEYEEIEEEVEEEVEDEDK